MESDFTQRLGTYIKVDTKGEHVSAFVPPPLPPDPPLDANQYSALLFEAGQALGMLNFSASLLPDQRILDRIVYSYVRKEAVLSSQIEGTQSSLNDLMLYDHDCAPGTPVEDARETASYMAALNHALARLDDLPLSLRLIREMHEILMTGSHGAGKQPGAFRTTQNWIGGTRPGNAAFIPPPPDKVMACLDNMEKFIHTEDNLPALVKAGLVHIQFETIHPFFDGNGRIGRLLITLMLYQKGLIKHPGLYLSLYFKRNRQDYYRLLDEVRTRGNWEAWLEFFLNGVIYTAREATQTAQKIYRTFERDRMRLEDMGRGANSAGHVLEAMQRDPVMTIRDLKNATGLSVPTVTKALERLMSMGIIHEITGNQRNRVFAYTEYLALLNEGM